MAIAAEAVIDASEHLGLVGMVVKRFLWTGLDFDDLRGAGLIGLVKASQAFDPTRGVQFSTLACPYIANAIRAFVTAEQRNRGFVQRNDEIDVPDDSPPGFDPVLEEETQILYAALDQLDDRERTILSRRFGLGQSTPDTLKSIARDLGISKERVRQLEAETMGKLRGLIPSVRFHRPCLALEYRAESQPPVDVAPILLAAPSPCPSPEPISIEEPLDMPAPTTPDPNRCPGCQRTHKNPRWPVCLNESCPRYRIREDGSYAEPRPRGGAAEPKTSRPKPPRRASVPAAIKPIVVPAQPAEDPRHVLAREAGALSTILTILDALPQASATRVLDWLASTRG